MQPLSVRLRTSRRRLVAETEAELHAAFNAAEKDADDSGAMGIVDFQAANGSSIGVLVGGADIALSFRYADDVEPRFLSLGDPAAVGSVAFTRDFVNQIECPRWALIARETGIAALTEFAESIELPLTVQWAAYPG